MFDDHTIRSITDIARTASLDPATLLAIAEVESAGRMTYPIQGRNEPAIRFEGHYFDRRLRGPTQQKARDLGLAASQAGKIRNPSDQMGRWQLLQRAMTIDRRAALESTSWGVGQVMGAHWQWLGYRSVEELVADVRQSTEGQIVLMLRFIEKAGLVEVLAARDWRNFARRYNDPAFARNHYDTKLAAAYLRWSQRLSHSRNLSAIIAAVDKTPPRA